METCAAIFNACAAALLSNTGGILIAVCNAGTSCYSAELRDVYDEYTMVSRA